MKERRYAVAIDKISLEELTEVLIFLKLESLNNVTITAVECEG